MIAKGFDNCKIYTPTPLANAIVKALAPNHKQKWLEPSFGGGVFLRAIRENGVPRRNILGIELEEQHQNSFDDFAEIIAPKDYLVWSTKSRRTFDRIVGNPPYIRGSRLQPTVLDSLTRTKVFGSAKSIGKQANLWFGFLCSALSQLRANGGIALVLPASWDYAQYANGLRQEIHTHFEQLYIIRSRRPLFDEVQDGSVIFIGLGFGQLNRTKARIECDGIDETIQVMSQLPRGGFKTHHPIGWLGLSETNPQQDQVWGLSSFDPSHPKIGFETTSRLSGRECEHKPVRKQNPNDTRSKLSDLLEIRLGGVTGQADFFLINEQKRRKLELPRWSCIPALTKSNHIVAAEIDNDVWNGLLCSNKRVWMFWPSLRVAEHEKVNAYLNLAAEDGGCDKTRYKIKQRDTWFQTPLPEKIDGFISGTGSPGPFLSFSRMRRLSASNTLYVFRFRTSMSRARRYGVAMALLTTFCQDQLSVKCRQYPSGLPKFEPSDLYEIRLPHFGNLKGIAAAYRLAILHKLNGDSKNAQEIADTFFS